MSEYERTTGQHQPFEQLSDAKLRDIIVSQSPAWEAAYEILLIDRHGEKVVKAVVLRFGPRNLELEFWEDFHGPLLLYLRGSHGLWAHLRAWDPDRGPFGPWLRVVVWRLCLSLLDDRPPQISLDDAISGPDGVATPLGELLSDPDAEGAFDESERWLYLEQVLPILATALKQLDSQCRVILIASYWEGRTDGDIGRELGRARESINRKKRACLRELQQLL